jgi:hypothetical protein
MSSERAGFSALFLSDIGSDLYGDMNVNNFTLRDAFKDKIAASVKELSQNRRLFLNGANAYLLPYADTTLNLPLESSKYFATDMEIPFLQMVLRGYVHYTGESINMAYDPELQFLKSLSYGAAPSFTLNWGEEDVLKNSNFAELFSTKFSSNLERTVEQYNRYKVVFKVIGNKAVTDYRKISDDVSETVFSGSERLLVNMGNTEYKADGITIKAMDFLILGGA